MAGGRFSVEAVFQAIDKFTRPIKKMQSKMQRFGEASNRALSGANRMADKVFTGFKRVGFAAAAMGTAVGTAMASVIRTGADFEQTLTAAATKFGGDIKQGTEAFRELDKVAKHVGATTEFRSQQAAEGLQFLGQAGLNAEQAIGALPGTVDLATAAGIELAQASDVATNVLGQFGLMADDSAQLATNLARANDAIAATTASANTNVTELSEAMAKGGPDASKAGASIETFAALTGTLANAGIKGSEAGTKLRNTFLNLQATTPKAEKQLSKLGISVNDTDGNMRDIIDILGEFQEKMKDMGTAEQATILKDIFGKRAIGGVSTLLEVGAEDLRKYREELEGATGKSEEMAAQMRDTTTGRMKELGAAVEGVKLKVFEAVKGPFSDIVESLTNWARANKKVISENVKGFVQFFVDNADGIKRFATFIGVLATALLAYSVAVKVVTAIQAVFNAVMLANPVVLIIMAIVAAIALIIAFWPEISAFLENIWNKAKEIFGNVADFLEGVWESIKGFFVGAFEFIVGVLRVLFAPQIAMFKFLFRIIGEAADFLIEKFRPVGEFLMSVWKGVKAEFMRQWDIVVSVAETIFEKVKEIWAPISDFFAGLWDGIVAHFKKVFGFIFDVIEKGVNFFRSVGRETLDGEEGDGPAVGGAGAAAGAIPGPEGATSRWFSESVNRDEVGISIFDETGRAGVTQKPKRSRNMPHMTPSGGF